MTNLPEHHGDVVGSFGLGGMDDKWDTKEMQANLGDEAIADGVKHLLRESPVSSALVVAVSVHDGRVLLSGVAPSPLVAATAIEIAASLPGVMEVIDDLRVGPPP